jgi:hypothetical protein
MGYLMPGKNHHYAGYLVGFGLGLLLGSLVVSPSPSEIPMYLVAIGVGSIIAGTILSYKLDHQKKKSGKNEKA